MLERKRNLGKYCKKRKPVDDTDNCSPSSKRGKLSNILQRYPAKLNPPPTKDYESIERHCKTLHTEMQKAKPRDSLLLPLMKSIFALFTLHLRIFKLNLLE